MEFKVRTKKLKNSSQSISGTVMALGRAESSIDSVLKNLDLGSETGTVRNSLRKSKEKLSFLKAATSMTSRNLDAIAVQYERTEAAIKNQKANTKYAKLFEFMRKAIERAKQTADAVHKKGENWYNKYVGDPVNLDSGNFIYETTDLSIEGPEPFEFRRSYNSLGDETGVFGKGWTHNFEIRLEVGIDDAVLYWCDGRSILFSIDKGEFSRISGGTAVLERDGENYVYQTEEGSYYLDRSGRFVRFENESGVGYSLVYSHNYLSRIEKDSGEYIRLTYEESTGKPVTAEDHSGRKVTYSYKGRDLTEASSFDQTTRYEYDSQGRITGVINPEGVRIVKNEYDAQNRVTAQRFPDGSEMMYSYDDQENLTVLRERNGSESYHYHDLLYRNTENVYNDGNESYEYNEKNQITYECDRNGNETRYKYDNKGNVTKLVMANGTVINITYEKHNKPATVSVNGERRLKNVYDDRGNLIETEDALGRRTTAKYNDNGLPVEVRNPSGKTAFLTYDERNNISSILDEHGVSYRYEYDELNRVIVSVAGRNNISRFSYDEHGNITMITDAAGNTRSYSYNRLNKLSEMVDFNGARTAIEYNNLGFPCRMTDPLGHITELEYDSMWNVTAEKMPNGGVRRIEYDENNRPVKEIDALGNETLYAYDGNGNLIFKTDAEGGQTEYRYDSMDELVYVRDPEGNETRYSYDSIGNLVQIRNANGGELELEYDEANQLIRETDPLGQSREYSYTADGDLAETIDEAGRILRIIYASKGKPEKIMYPDGREEYFAYDENGNISNKSNKQGFSMNYVYDELGRLIEASGNNGEHYSYTYDEIGNLTSAADADGNTSRYEYNLNGQLISVTDELGNRTEYEYDAMDMLTGIRKLGDGEAHYTEYIRDLAGNVIKTIDPLGYIEEYAYSKKGELTKKTDKDGYLTEFRYDLNGRLNSVRYGDGREVMMSHDALGKLSEIRDWTGKITVESDIIGRVTKVTYPDNRTAEYTYGKAGERTSIKHPDGRVVSYGYDEMLRLRTLREGNTDISYDYDAVGRLVCKTFADGLVTRYSYGNNDLLTGVSSTYEGKELDSVRLVYDANGNRIAAERFRNGLPEESGIFEYEYDAAWRLTGVSKDGIMQRKYSYDAFGNRASLETAEGRTDYTYDAMDRLAEVSGERAESFRYDKRGNVIGRVTEGKPEKTFSYGAINRLEKVTSEAGTAVYEYNGLGHRTGELLRLGTQPERRISYTLDLTKNYNNLLERTIDGDSDTFIWDGTPLAMKGREEYVYTCDEMGSPYRLLGMDGSNAEIYGYDEFGITMQEASSAQPFGYAGYRKDPVTDMYFAQAREYMPEHGRFAGQDWVKGHIAVPATLNAYIFCNSMPFRYVDLDGRFLITAVLATMAVGAGVGAIVGGGWELGSQLVGQVTTGDHQIHLDQINTGKIFTSAFSGAITGGFTAVGHPVVGATLGGFAEGSINSALEGKGFWESMGAGVIEGAVSGVFAGAGELFKKTKLAGKIKNSIIGNNRISRFFRKFGGRYKGQLKRALTLAEKGTFIHLGWKTWRNGLISEGWKKVSGNFKPKKYLKSLTKGLLKCALLE